MPVIAVTSRDVDLQRLEPELQEKIEEAEASGSLTDGLGVIDVSAVTGQPLALAALAAMVGRLALRRPGGCCGAWSAARTWASWRSASCRPSGGVRAHPR